MTRALARLFRAAVRMGVVAPRPRAPGWLPCPFCSGPRYRFFVCGGGTVVEPCNCLVGVPRVTS